MIEIPERDSVVSFESRDGQRLTGRIVQARAIAGEVYVTVDTGNRVRTHIALASCQRETP